MRRLTPLDSMNQEAGMIEKNQHRNQVMNLQNRKTMDPGQTEINKMCVLGVGVEGGGLGGGQKSKHKVFKRTLCSLGRTKHYKYFQPHARRRKRRRRKRRRKKKPKPLKLGSIPTGG